MELSEAVERAKKYLQSNDGVEYYYQTGLSRLEAEALRTLIEHAERQSLLFDAVDLLASDPHSFGTQTCSTCRSVSNALSKPFGCDAVRESMKPRKEPTDVQGCGTS